MSEGKDTFPAKQGTGAKAQGQQASSLAQKWGWGGRSRRVSSKCSAVRASGRSEAGCAPWTQERESSYTRPVSRAPSSSVRV